MRRSSLSLRPGVAVRVMAILMEGGFSFGNGCQPIEIAVACLDRSFQMGFDHSIIKLILIPSK
jgi:hypothetical protein